MKKNVLAGDAKQIERKIIFYNFKGGNKMKKRQALSAVLATAAYSARTAHPFQRNGAPFRFKLSKAQQVD